MPKKILTLFEKMKMINRDIRLFVDTGINVTRYGDQAAGRSESRGTRNDPAALFIFPALNNIYEFPAPFLWRPGFLRGKTRATRENLPNVSTVAVRPPVAPERSAS
jgi:hypothetical protein